MLGGVSGPTTAIAVPTPVWTRALGSPGSAPETTSDVTALAGLASALTLLGAEPALPEPALPEGVQVQWTGAPGCPDVAVAKAHIARRLQGREGPVRASVVVALVSNAEGGYGLSLDVELASETVHRELESSDCEVLLEATAVVVGIAIEPELPVEMLRTAELVEPPDAPAVPEAPPAITDPAPAEVSKPQPRALSDEPPTVTVPRRRYPLRGAVRVHGGAGVGVLPGVSGSAGFRLGLLGPRWRVEGGADRTFQTQETFATEPEAGARFTMWSGTVRGCYAPAWRRLEFPVCGGASAGRVRAQGFGGGRTRNPATLWAAAVVAPGLLWLPHPNVGLGASVDALVAMWRPNFTGELQPGTELDLYVAAPVAARALGFVEFRWGS